MFIEVNKVGEKVTIDLNLNHIVFIGKFYKSTLAPEQLAELQAKTCIVALSNGVVMHIQISRDTLIEAANK